MQKQLYIENNPSQKIKELEDKKLEVS